MAKCGDCLRRRGRQSELSFIVGKKMVMRKKKLEWVPVAIYYCHFCQNEVRDERDEWVCPVCFTESSHGGKCQKRAQAPGIRGAVCGVPLERRVNIIEAV